MFNRVKVADSLLIHGSGGPNPAYGLIDVTSAKEEKTLLPRCHCRGRTLAGPLGKAQRMPAQPAAVREEKKEYLGGQLRRDLSS